jgi:hypothetical protein
MPYTPPIHLHSALYDKMEALQNLQTKGFQNVSKIKLWMCRLQWHTQAFTSYLRHEGRTTS